MFADVQASYSRALFVLIFVVAMSFPAASAGPASPSQPTSPAQKARIAETYGKLPLSFEANTGQADKTVKFLSRGRGYGLYLTGNDAELTLCQAVSRAARPDLRRNPGPIPKSAACDIVRVALAGAGGKTEPVGEEQLPGTVNYFIGSDPAKWRTSVPTYAKVRYAGIYPGIDLVYYGNQQQLEFDFVVAPNADPRAIRLRFSGPNHLHVATNGDLILSTANGTLTVRKPATYQAVDGRRVPRSGEFALLAKSTVGFRVRGYDRVKPLVIDPVLVYSTFLGGSGDPNAALIGGGPNAIAVDVAGNAYVAGQTFSSDFPVTQGAFQTSNNAASQGTAFVSKLNPTGTALVYSTYLGGSYGDSANAIAVDAAGNAYVAGQTSSPDFPVTQEAFQTTNHAARGATAFVAKLNPTGTALVYSTYLGGSVFDSAYAIAVDAAGNAYVAGQTNSTDFPATQGAFQVQNNAAGLQVGNAFVTKLNPAGTALVYSTYLGGSGEPEVTIGGFRSAQFVPTGEEDGADAIAVDAAGNAYVAGTAVSTDFPVTAGAYQTHNNAAANQVTNAFVAKLNPTGTSLVYSTYLGGSGARAPNTAPVTPYAGDASLALAVDSAGDAYVAGIAFSSDFPVTQGAFQSTNRFSYKGDSGPNAFVAKLNPSGTTLVYSTYLGGSGGFIDVTPDFYMFGGDQATGLAIDNSGNAYITGSTASADFPVTAGAYQSTNNYPADTGYDAFVTELNPAGSGLTYSTYLGGNGSNPNVESSESIVPIGDTARALARDGFGNVYVAGAAESANFPVSGGAFQTTIQARQNAFVAKLNMSATSTAIMPTVTVTPASSTITSGRPLTVGVSVSGGSGNPMPTGAVTLVSGTYASPPTTLAAGSATVNVPAGSLLPEPAGSRSGDELTADYAPDTASSSTYNSNTGMATVYVIGPNISVTPSSTTPTWAQAQSQPLSVAMVATAGAGNPVPTGTVTLTAGSWSSAATALSGGSATITVPPGTLTTGFNTLNVSYSGDSNYAPENPAGSALVAVGVVTVSVVPSSSTISSTQALPVTITVSAGSGSPTPTGMVWLDSGYYASAATSLTGGGATLTIPGGILASGVDILEASYGEGNYAAAAGHASVTVTAPPGVTITGTPVTVTAGATTGNTSTITVTPTGGFTGSVVLTALVAPDWTGVAYHMPTVSFGATSPVNISGTAAGTATLAVTTTAAVGCSQAQQRNPEVPWYTGGGAILACLMLFSISVRRRRWRPALGMAALLIIVAASLLACGGGSNSTCNGTTGGTTPGPYTIIVYGTSGATGTLGQVMLTVQ
jgi:hypothetical protein